jgi:hypothetical protein
MVENNDIGKLLSIIRPESKSLIEAVTIILIIVFSLIFSHIFIIPLDFLRALPNWMVYIGVAVLFYIVKFSLYDKLYYGNPDKDKYVRAFQLYWPSTHLSKKFNISKKDAFYYWYEKLFNKWRAPNSERHSQYLRSLRRGYACRFIFYTLKYFKYLLIVSIILTSLQLAKSLFYPKLNSYLSWINIKLGWACTFIAIIACLYLFIRMSNKPDPANLKGVWQRYAEINEMHTKWIDEHIPSLDYLKNL